MSATASSELARALVSNRRQFLAFLRRQVRSEADAEELLQAALARAVEKAGSLRDEESVVAWFYRLLRNAVTDHHRHQAAKGRALERVQDEAEPALEEGLHRAVCQCVLRLLPTLKPEYAEILRRVELEGEPVAGAAGALGISANNASVRLHRARAALGKQLRQTCRACARHGCLDCSCAG